MTEKYHPLTSLKWVDPETLHSNHYNPNTVFPPEMRLLKISILEDGWTQPIVIREDGVIVDGFHRWTLGLRDPEVRAISNSKVPVVVLSSETTKTQQMMATIRHNRARGQHGILAMSSILQELKEEGVDNLEIGSRLGMENEEVRRLEALKASPTTKGRDSFGKGWIPVKKTVNND